LFCTAVWYVVYVVAGTDGRSTQLQSYRLQSTKTVHVKYRNIFRLHH